MFECFLIIIFERFTSGYSFCWSALSITVRKRQRERERERPSFCVYVWHFLLAPIFRWCVPSSGCTRNTYLMSVNNRTDMKMFNSCVVRWCMVYCSYAILHSMSRDSGYCSSSSFCSFIKITQTTVNQAVNRLANSTRKARWQLLEQPQVIVSRNKSVYKNKQILCADRRQIKASKTMMMITNSFHAHTSPGAATIKNDFSTTGTQPSTH